MSQDDPHPVLDGVGVDGFTLRGWIERQADGYRRRAQAARADAGTQAEPEARLYDQSADVIEALIGALEKAQTRAFGTCDVREHAGLEKLGQKLNAGERLLPDPELGQDVAFAAFAIERQWDFLHAAAKRLKGVERAIEEDVTDGDALVELEKIREEMEKRVPQGRNAR